MSSLSNFQKLKELGKGSFSTVYKVCRKSDNKEYAMKVVKITQLSEKERQNALNEIRILASIVDPNIVAYKEAFFDESIKCLCIIMEYAEAGDLMSKINAKKQQKTYFSENQIWKSIIQMTKGLRTLHNLKILHRDLKCANIFVTGNGVLKLGDLNVSKITQKGLAITQAGTPYYCAPEVWKGNVYDKKCDIWSLGCVLYELAALKPPFQGTGMKDLFNRISKGEFERIPKIFSNELFDIIRHCLRLNPNERPSCDDILNNPCIRERFPEELNKENIISKAQLLNTIKMPRNLQGLKEKLPKPNYEILNKSFEGEEGERNVMRRCPSESGLRENNELPKENEVVKAFKNEERAIPREVVRKSYKYEEKSPISRPKTPFYEGKIKNNEGRIRESKENKESEARIRELEYKNRENPQRPSYDKPPIQLSKNVYPDNPVRFERKVEKVGQIKSNKVEQPLKKPPIDPRAANNVNLMNKPPPYEAARQVGRIERPASRPEIKRLGAEEQKHVGIVNRNANLAMKRPESSRNKRPTSQQDLRRAEKPLEKQPQIKNNGFARKENYPPKPVPKTPVTPSNNRENIVLGKRNPVLEVKKAKK